MMSNNRILGALSSRHLVAAELMALLALLATTLSIFGAQGWGMTAAFAVAYAVPRLAYARLSGGEGKGAVVMAAAGAAMVAWAVANVYSWTTAVGHTLNDPLLTNDDNTYYRWALHFFDGSVEEPDTKFIGFPLLILGSWKLLGHSIVWPIAINVMLTLLTIVTTGQMAGRALEHRVSASRAHVTFLAMLGTCLLCYMMSHGALLLKEPLTYFAVSLAAYAIARMKATEQPGSLWPDLTVFTAAIAILAITRTGVIYFVMLGVALALIDCRRMWRYAFALTGIALIGVGVGIYWSNGFSTEVQMRIVAGTSAGGGIMGQIYQASGIYGDAMSNYFMLPMWRKLLLLPVTCLVQLFIPFPWPGVEGFSLDSFFTRMQWGWYATAGIAIYYLFALSWRRSSLGWWALWPFLCFAAAAFTTGGSVSRYILPYQPLLVVVAVWVLCRWREEKWRRTFKIWCGTYAAVVAIVLLYCFALTSA